MKSTEVQNPRRIPMYQANYTHLLATPQSVVAAMRVAASVCLVWGKT